MSAAKWFALASVLASLGFVIQHVVADGMSIEAIPDVDESGARLVEADRRILHTTMQTLGRVCILAATALIAALNL
ncbi:MAG TPA: hypothetical protein VFA74_16105, partial [Terriglobales bacterium]|nr:hypothetical protein [Terriglobales bacterium]